MANIMGIQVPPIRDKEEAENILRQTMGIEEALGGLNYGDMSDYGKMRNYLGVMQSLLENKRGYANAKSDTERATYSQKGAINRKLAEDMGIDISSAADRYNADEYAEYLKGIENQTKNRVLYRKHPDEIAAKIYTDYLKQGVDEGTARRRTIAEVMPYATQYESMARYSMNDYGVKDGAMMDAAGLILSGMSPQAAQINSALYLTPADMRKYGEKENLMHTAADIQSGQSAQNFAQNKDLLTTKGEIQERLNQGAYAHDMNKMVTGANLSMAVLRDKLKAMSEAELERIDTLINKYGYSLPQAIGNVTDDNTNDNEIAIRAVQSKEFAKNALDLINHGGNPREAAKLILQAEELRPTLQNANIPKNILKEYEERQSNLMKAFENKFRATYKEALENVNFNGGK